MRILVKYPVDWIVGHLRYGHMEGIINLSKEEYAEFQKDPAVYLKSHDELIENFDLLVDDYRVYDYSNDIYDVSYTEKI